jgi:hypothetical protein
MLLALALAAVGAASAEAHVPFLEPDRRSDQAPEPGEPYPGAIKLPDVAVSRAVYGTLAGDAPFDAWELRVGEMADTPIEMLVPAFRRYEGFRPSFVLIGPGLPSAGEPPGSVVQRLERAGVAGDVGVMVVHDPGADPRSTFYEPFSFTRYFEGGRAEVSLRPGVRYHLVVFDPDDGLGEYALGIGSAERFTARDAAYSVVAVLRIKLGLYGQGAVNWLNVALLVAAFAAIVAAVTLLLGRRRRAA